MKTPHLSGQSSLITVDSSHVTQEVTGIQNESLSSHCICEMQASDAHSSHITLVYVP